MQAWAGLIAALLVIWLLVTFWWVIVGAVLIWLFHRAARKDSAALLGTAMVGTAVYVLWCAALHNWFALALAGVAVLLGTSFNWERLAAAWARGSASRARAWGRLAAMAERTMQLRYPAFAAWARLRSAYRARAKVRFGARMERALQLRYPTYVRRSEP